jgi:hypothetical protein
MISFVNYLRRKVLGKSVHHWEKEEGLGSSGSVTEIIPVFGYQPSSNQRRATRRNENVNRAVHRITTIIYEFNNEERTCPVLPSKRSFHWRQ